MHVYGFQPNQVSTVYHRMDEQLIGPEWNSGEVELAHRGSVFHELRRGVAEITAHVRGYISEGFYLSHTIEIEKVLFVGDKFRFVDFPVIVESGLDLLVPNLGVLGGEQNNACGRCGLRSFRNLHGSDDGSRLSGLKQAQQE